ncbi:hypothetical protein LTR94_028154, partial [Friedmanniomyces endolithicus]
MEAVRGHFRPEFLNRIDEIILFHRLGRDQMGGIVRIQLARFEKLLADRRLSLDLDEAALGWLSERGYDPVYGARPLKRVIQKELVDPIARRRLTREAVAPTSVLTDQLLACRNRNLEGARTLPPTAEPKSDPLVMDLALRDETYDFLDGDTAMAEAMRGHDWSATPLGAPRDWPVSLKTAVSLMLATRQPAFLAWGPDLTFLYNDAYLPFLASRHPTALGAPLREVWADVWTDLEPLVDEALAGRATWSEDLHLVMSRKGYAEDTWWSFSYSPLRDESGAVVGLLDL